MFFSLDAFFSSESVSNFTTMVMHLSRDYSLANRQLLLAEMDIEHSGSHAFCSFGDIIKWNC